MNYWVKTLFKFSNLTNSVYNFSNNGSETKKMASKLLTEETRHVGRWSPGNTSHVKQWTQGKLAYDHVSSYGTLTREHVSTQGMLAREYARHVGTWARF